MAVFKPQITRLIIEPTEADWSQAQKEKLSQTSMLYDLPDTQLEKIPYEFKYEFRCADPDCRRHRMSCTDWEIGQSYRHWRQAYGQNWEEAFRNRYEREMIEKFDTHFFVGNLHQHPRTWIVVGLFYPPKRKPVPDLFSNHVQSS